jgi:phosphatidylinositol glycan class T
MLFLCRSVTTVRVDFEYSMLRWTEYPPDANHGFYVGAAVITARLPSGSIQNATLLAR